MVSFATTWIRIQKTIFNDIEPDAFTLCQGVPEESIWVFLHFKVYVESFCNEALKLFF